MSISTLAKPSSTQAVLVKDAVDYILRFSNWKAVTDCVNTEMLVYSLSYCNRNGGLFSCLKTDGQLAGIMAGWPENFQQGKVEFIFADNLIALRVMMKRFVTLYPDMHLSGYRHGKPWTLTPEQQNRIIYGR